jgi:hypothetical protein
MKLMGRHLLAHQGHRSHTAVPGFTQQFPACNIGRAFAKKKYFFLEPIIISLPLKKLKF